VQTFWEPSSCLFELKCALKAIEQVTPDIFLLHGRLCDPSSVSVYTLSEKDLKSIFDDEKLFAEFMDYLTDKNSNITIKDGNARLKR